MSDERREFPRADINFDVNYYEEKNPEMLYGKNICAGGMAFRTNELLKTGTVLQMVFKTPGNNSEIRARVRVVRAWSENDEFLAGAEFFEIESADKTMLAQLVDNYLSRETTPV